MALATRPNVKNIVTNGNFANGTTGWVVPTSASLSVEDSTLSVTGTGLGASPYAYETTSILASPGKKLYIRAKVTALTSVCQYVRFCVSGSTGGSVISVGQITSPTQNQEYANSCVSTITDQTGNIRIWQLSAYGDNAAANGKTTKVREFLVIDLTETFGAGKEPDLATCDQLFAEWFDGGKYFPELAVPKGISKTAVRQNNAVMVPGGKNLLNLYDELYKLDPRTLTRTVKDGRQCISIGNPSYYNTKSILTGRFKPNTQYTLKFDIAVNMTLNAMSGLIFVLNYTDGTKLNCYYTPNTDESLKTMSFTTQAGKSVQSLSLTFAYNKDTYIDENTIQLEEGLTATAYEPYKPVNKPELR